MKTLVEFAAEYISNQADHKSMSLSEETQEGSKPRTPKQKKLARMYGDPNKITQGDVLKARGVVEDFDDEDCDEDIEQLNEWEWDPANIAGAALLGTAAYQVGKRVVGGIVNAAGDYVDNRRAAQQIERYRTARAQRDLQNVQKRNKNRMTSIDPADKDPNTGKIIDRRAGGGSDTPLSGIFHVSSGRDRGYHGYYLSPDGKSGGHVKVLVPADQSGNAESLIRQKMAKHTHLSKPQREEVTNALIAHTKSQSPGQAVAEQYAAYISNQDRRNLFEAADYTKFSNVRPDTNYVHTDLIDEYIKANKIRNVHGTDNNPGEGVMTVRGEHEWDSGPDAPVRYYKVHNSVLAKHPDLHKMLQAMDSQAVEQYNKRK